jgi:hypothetical protein
MASDHIRASDRDRDAVVGMLRDAFAEGRLTLEEFQERTTAAYAGRTWGDLRELTGDLPVQPFLGADLPADAHPDGASLPAGVQSPPGARLPGVPVPGPHPVPGFQSGIPPYPRQTSEDDMRQPVRNSRGHPFGPVLPVIGMWILFALATRSADGAVAFLITVALLVTVASLGRRPPRGPSGGQGGPPAGRGGPQ